MKWADLFDAEVTEDTYGFLITPKFFKRMMKENKEFHNTPDYGYQGDGIEVDGPIGTYKGLSIIMCHALKDENFYVLNHSKDDQVCDAIHLYELRTQYLKDKPQFLFFWRHDDLGTLTRTCLSQWWLCNFESMGFTFHYAEQYMMAKKALLFGDYESFGKIMKTDSPANAKRYGRLVKNFNEYVWNRHRFDIVVEGNYLKFSQNKELGDYLLATGNAIIVEASPHDPIWGIGLSSDDRDALDPFKWKGLNLLGFALMEVRKRLREEK